MILSIDRVLQLLAEGKSLDTIAQKAGVHQDDVAAIIEDARGLLNKHDKTHTKKKIIIKKNKTDESKDYAEFMEGADFTAVPMGATLTIYTDGASSGNPGRAGIGIVILDEGGNQVGKVSRYIGHETNNVAEYRAIIEALVIAVYFKTEKLKLRTDSELIVKQIAGEYRVKNENLKPLYRKAVTLIDQIPHCSVEHIRRDLNDKADYLAKKATEAE